MLTLNEEDKFDQQIVCNLDKNVTRGELADAFHKVCDCQDWKAPISAWIFAEDVPLVLAAIEFFTATKGKLVESHLTNENRVECLIKADGYRLGPAGDH